MIPGHGTRVIRSYKGHKILGSLALVIKAWLHPFEQMKPCLTRVTTTGSHGRCAGLDCPEACQIHSAGRFFPSHSHTILNLAWRVSYISFAVSWPYRSLFLSNHKTSPDADRHSSMMFAA